MKLSKIFSAFMVGVLACSCAHTHDNDIDLKWNTASGVTVSMEKSEVEVKENTGLFYVPLVVTGDPNGYVQVTVKIIETGTNPAIEDANFYVTSKTINISNETKTASVQIKAVEFDDENPTYTFLVEIEDVKYATAGADTETLVSIKDRGASPTIDRLPGTWIGSYVNADGGTSAFTSELSIVDASTGLIKMTGFFDPACELELYYQYDAAKRYGEFFIPYGSYMGTFNFVGFGACDVRLTDSQGTVNPEKGFKGKWNEDYTGIVFTNLELFVGVYQGSTMHGFMDYMKDLTLTNTNSSLPSEN